MSEPVLVVPPEPELRFADEPFGEGIRAPFRVSETGRTVASAVYLASGASRVDIIDVDRLALRTTLPRYAYAVSDSAALVRAPDGSKNKLELVDLISGAQIWSSSLDSEFPEGILVFSAFISGERVIVQFERGSVLVVARLDQSTGAAKELLAQDGGDREVIPLYLSTGLSDGDHLIMLPAPGVGPSIEGGGGQVSVAILDGQTGILEKNAFELGGAE